MYTTFNSITNIQKEMPRVQRLSQLTPNKVYSIEGMVKFKHESEGYTTLILEQDSVQKTIKIPLNQTDIQAGLTYKFGNCFYNSKGWLMVRKPAQTIQLIRSEDQQDRTISLTLKDIKENLGQIDSKYFSTYLFVHSIQPKQVFNKNEKDIPYQVIKGYSQNCLIDMTIWNSEHQIQKVLNKWVLVEGVRIKKMADEKFVLVSSVFTKISECDWQIKDQFDQKKLHTYNNVSQIYHERPIWELAKMAIPEQKIFSIVKARIKSIVSVDYYGCTNCKRKIEESCQLCKIPGKVNYSYGKVVLEAEGEIIETIVFDQKIRQLFKFAKQNCTIQGRIKTFGRIQDGESVISHILTKIDGIFF